MPIYATDTTVTRRPRGPMKGKAFTITAKVTRRGTSSLVTAMPVTLQRHVKGETVWRPVSTATTSSRAPGRGRSNSPRLTYYRLVRPA